MGPSCHFPRPAALLGPVTRPPRPPILSARNRARAGLRLAPSGLLYPLGIGKMGAAMPPATGVRRVLFAVALGFMAALGASAHAGPFEDGSAACYRGD